MPSAGTTLSGSPGSSERRDERRRDELLHFVSLWKNASVSRGFADTKFSLCFPREVR